MIKTINIFGISIHLYSLCILVGILVAYYLIIKESKKHGIKDEIVMNLIFYGIIFGILGARIYYVIFNYDYYLNNLAEIYKIWNGGLAIHGGIIAGIIFIYFYTKKYSIKFIKMLDIIAPGLIIAQAIGRWGNFFNQEAFGFATSKIFLESLFIPKFIINGMFIEGSYYLPTFYFESIWCILGFIIMIVFRKNKKLKVGTISSLYFIWYGIGRFIIEHFRTDSLMFGAIKQAQIISIFLILIGIVILIKKNKELYYKE